MHDRPATDMDTSRIQASDTWIAQPGGRLFARIWRNPAPRVPDAKAPIVLFHDSLGCVDLWRDFPARLCVATGRDIVAYDRLGFGRSDPRNDTLSMDFVADEAIALRAVVDQLGLRRFVAFGHSVGGGMAVHCAARYPSGCAALVTESAQAFVGEETVRGIQAAKLLFEDESQFSRLEKYHADKARWVLDAWIDTWLAPGFAAWSLRQVLPSVRCPVLALHGASDEYGTPAHAGIIAAHAGGPATVCVLPDTGHVPHRERTKETLEAVASFLATIE